MRRFHYAIATWLFVIVCTMAVQAQGLPKVPGTESSPKSTKPEDAQPAGSRKLQVLIFDPKSEQSDLLQRLIKFLVPEQAAKPGSSAPNIEEPATADGITVTLALRAEEPFEKVQALIEGLQQRGVTKLALKTALNGSEQSAVELTADANVPTARRQRVVEYLVMQKELKLELKSDWISATTAALLLVKSDWSQVPAAKEIEAELRQVLKEIAVPQEKLDRLPASAAEILFAPNVVGIYSAEHYGQLLAWLNKRGLVVQTIRSDESINEFKDEAGGHSLPQDYAQIRNRCEFLHLPLLPQVTSEPFVSRWVDFSWIVRRQTSNTTLVDQLLQILEQGRGQATARTSERLDGCRFTFAGSIGQVAILSAFPKQPEGSALRRACREQGLEVLLVVDLGRRDKDQPSSDPQLRLPDQVDALQPGGRGLNWPAPSQNPGRYPEKKTATTPPNDAEIRNFNLENANAVAVSELVQQLFNSQSIVVTADPRTNTILARGSQDLLAQIEAVVMKLDQTPKATPGPDPRSPNPFGTSKTDLQSSDSKSLDYRIYANSGQRLSSGRSSVASLELKKQYDAQEQKATLTAQRLRELLATGSTNDPLIDQLRTELRAAVRAAFSARQQLHLAELAEFQYRARQIQETIATRSGIQDQIIDRRIEDLLNPNLRWESDKIGEAPATFPSSDSQMGSDARPRIPGWPTVPGSKGSGGGQQDKRNSVPSNPNLKKNVEKMLSPLPLKKGRGEGNSTETLHPNRLPKGEETKYTPLSDAVRAFNERNATYRIGKDQPPLTDDEIVATIRWSVTSSEKRNLSTEVSSALEAIAENRLLPDNAQLELLTDFEQPDGSKLTKWTIQLTLHRADGTSTQRLIREQLVRWQPKPGAVSENPSIDVNLANPKEKEKPLAAAIHGFNLQHQSDRIGKNQPPLTEEEVIAAIRWWKTKRNEADLTNEEFQAFQKIADTGLLPEKVEFEVLTGFQPNQEFEFDAWSVRIVMPRLSKSGWTYGFTIRDRWIHSRRLGDRQISWGPPAANGIQAGVLFEPHNEQYTSGQQIRPSFFYRNVGSQPMSVAFPRLMTHSYYDSVRAVDNAGRDIVIDQDSGPGGPVGWIQMPLDPKSQHEIKGLPIALGDVSREAGVETVIRAQPGQSCRVRFTVSNYGEPKSEPIQTGEVLFTLAAELPGPVRVEKR